MSSSGHAFVVRQLPVVLLPSFVLLFRHRPSSLLDNNNPISTFSFDSQPSSLPTLVFARQHHHPLSLYPLPHLPPLDHRRLRVTMRPTAFVAAFMAGAAAIVQADRAGISNHHFSLILRPPLT